MEKHLYGTTGIAKRLALKYYPKKIKLLGGHSDLNRFLVSKGREPIYHDNDEAHEHESFRNKSREA
jgi:hypothetical protein